MKKVLLILTIILASICFRVNAYEVPEATDHEKVTIYIFRGTECPHCYDALKFFYENMDDFEKIVDVKAIEVWDNKDNKDFLNEVLKYYGDEDQGVPYLVIGESYSEPGYIEGMEEDILNAAFTEYQNDEYHDVVAELLAKNDKVKVQTLKEAWYEENNIDPDGRTHNHDTLIIIGIFAVLICGGYALIHFSRK